MSSHEELLTKYQETQALVNQVALKDNVLTVFSLTFGGLLLMIGVSFIFFTEYLLGSLLSFSVATIAFSILLLRDRLFFKNSRKRANDAADSYYRSLIDALAIFGVDKNINLVFPCGFMDTPVSVLATIDGSAVQISIQEYAGRLVFFCNGQEMAKPNSVESVTN